MLPPLPSLSLSIEQEFHLRTLESQAESLSAEDARALLVEVVRQGLIKDIVIRHLLKNA
jgi:hypothetical protein